MSFDASAWAVKAAVSRSSTKNLLMILAHITNDETGELYPSLGYLEAHTGLSRKTVIDCLQELESPEVGVLIRTGRMEGRTQQIPVYRFIKSKRVPTIERGTGGKFHRSHHGAETVAILPGKGGVFSKETVVKTPPGIEKGNREEEYIPPLPSEGAPQTENQDLFGGTSESPEDAAARQMKDLLGSIVTRWKALSESNKLIPNVRNLDDRRRKTVVRLTQAFTETTPEALWDEIFARIAESQFLRGLSAPGKGRDEPWAIKFDWLINKTNFQKVLEGNFRDNRRDHQSFDAVSGQRITEHDAARHSVNERIRSGINRARAAGDRPADPSRRLGYSRPGHS